MIRPDLHRNHVVAVEVAGLGGSVDGVTTMRISVIDGSLADADMSVLASAQVANWDGAPVTVLLDLPGPPHSDWAVFAHAGLGPTIRPGDWITTSSFPITGTHVAIALDRV